MQKVLDDQGKKLSALAADIVAEGLSPIERLLVIPASKNSSDFIVVEGNRRLTALKILANPSVLSSLSLEPSDQKKLERLAKSFDRKTVEPISCFNVGTRDAATKWIFLRHTGENDGRGVVPWSGLARARFRGSNPGLQALDFVKKYGGLSSEHLELLDEAFPITTLERLLSSKEVRALLGVDLKDGKVNSSLPGSEVIKPLRKVVLDLAEKRINVNNIKLKDDQVKYVKSFGAKDVADLSKRGSARDLEDFQSTEFDSKSARTARPQKKRKSYDPSTRNQVVPRDSALNVSNAKVAEIYKELRKLKIDESPNSCAVLLRVFLELSVDSYMRKNGISEKEKDKNGRSYDKNLNKKLQNVVDDLVEKKGCRRKDFSGVNRALGDKHSPLHVDLLHAYVHNLFHIPKERDLRSAWDEAAPLFEQIWK